MNQLNERMIFQIVLPCDPGLLVRIAMGNQLALGGDDERVALLADSDSIDHVPHFFEVDLTHEPSRRASDMHQANSDDACGQEIVIDGNRRHRDVVAEFRPVLGNL